MGILVKVLVILALFIPVGVIFWVIFKKQQNEIARMDARLEAIRARTRQEHQEMVQRRIQESVDRDILTGFYAGLAESEPEGVPDDPEPQRPEPEPTVSRWELLQDD